MTILSSGKTITVTAIAKTQETKSAIQEAVGTYRGLSCSLQVAPLAAAAETLRKSATPQVLAVEVDLEDERELDHLSQLSEAFEGRLPMVALVRSTDLKGMRRLMQIGVADIVPLPLRAGDLISAITSAQRARHFDTPGQEADPRRGRVVTVLKSTGGVGATTLAVHLATAYGRRLEAEATAGLVDLDLQFGSAGLYMDVEGEATVLDVLGAGDRLDAELVRSTAIRKGKHLQVLPAPGHLTPLEAVSPPSAERLIRTCADAFPQTVVELPTTWTAWTHAVLSASDVVVLVTQLTVAGIRHAARQLATMHEEGLHHLPVLVVVNRHERGLFGDDMVRDAEKALGRSLQHFVPSDFKTMSKSANCGSTLYDMKTGRKVVKRIEKVADAALALAVPATRTASGRSGRV